MTSQNSSATISSYRFAGKAAIASGIIGLIAFGFLFSFLIPHLTVGLDGGFFIRSHDLAVILQFMLLIPVVFGLYKFTYNQPIAMSWTMMATGVGTLSFILIFPKVLADTLYMIPQGVFGAWLVITCWRVEALASRSLRWFGIIVGIGMALVSTFPIGFAIFVDAIVLRIPAAKAEDFPTPDTFANGMIHLLLLIGTLMGVITLPIWSILIGRRLLRGKNNKLS